MENSGRDTNGGGRGGRGRSRGGGRGGTTQTTFKGASSALAGHVFDVDTSGDGVDMFNRTMQEVETYVGTTYKKYTIEIVQAVRDLSLVMPPAIPDPNAAANAIEIQVWKEQRKIQADKTQEFSDFKAGLYSLIYGQCTKTLQEKLKAAPGFSGAIGDGIASDIGVCHMTS